MKQMKKERGDSLFAKFEKEEEVRAKKTKTKYI